MPGLIQSAYPLVKIIHCKPSCYVIQKRSSFWDLFKKKEEKKCVPVCKKITPCDKIETKGMSMPIIGIGTWLVDPECVDSVISYGFDVGYRHIDTSHSYGNQGAIGLAIDRLYQAGKFCRNEVFISSKLPYYGMTPEQVPRYVEDALNCLGLDYIDLFMIHFPVGIKPCGTNYTPDLETNHIHIWKAMEEQVMKGCVKSLGLSNFNMRQIKNIIECSSIPPANLQIEMHLYSQQKELRDFCSQHCIGVTAYAPLGSPGLDQYLMKNCLQVAKVPQPLRDHSVNMIACKHKVTPAQVLLRFLLQCGVAVIPKSISPERLCKNFDLFNFELDSCEMEELCNKDMGENGRMFGCNVWVGTEEHPEYPFSF